MQTNMQDDSGVYMTAVVENGTSGGSPDTNIFALNAATIHRTTNGANCDGSADTFVGNDDNPWLGQGVNGPDILNHGDFLWNVDTIGAVDVVGDYADCTIYYEDMAGSVSLEPVSSGGSVVKDSLLDGLGRICNSRSYTDCEAETAVAYNLGVSMFDVGYGAQGMTFAAASVSHICSGTGTETALANRCYNNDPNYTCLPWLLDGASSPAGCQLLCMSTEGLGTGSPVSALAIWEEAYDDDVDTCGDAGGTFAFTMVNCLPNQMNQCTGGFYALDTSDVYTVEDGGLGEKLTAEYLDYIFLDMATLDASNLWDPVEGTNTLRDQVTSCESTGDRVKLSGPQFFGTLVDSGTSPDCFDVASRFIFNPDEATPGWRIPLGEFSLDIITVDGTDYLRVFHTWESNERQLFWNQTIGIADSLLSAPGIEQLGVSLEPPAVLEADRHLYTEARDKYIIGQLSFSWVDPDVAQAMDILNVGDPNHYLVMVQLEDDGTTDCGVAGNYGFYLEAVGNCANPQDYSRVADDYNIKVTPVAANEETPEANLNSIFLTSAQVDTLAGASDPDTPAEWEIGVSKTMRELATDCSGRGGLAAIPYVLDGQYLVNPDSVICEQVLKRFVPDAIDHLVNNVTGEPVLLHPLKIDFTEVDLDPGAGVDLEQYIHVEVFDRDSSSHSRLFDAFEDVEDGLITLSGENPVMDPIPRGWFIAAEDDRASAQMHQPKVPADADPGGVDGQPLNVYNMRFEQSPGEWIPTWQPIDFQPITAPGTDVRIVNKVGAFFDIHRVEESQQQFANTPFNFYIFISLTEPVDDNGATVEPGHAEYCNYAKDGVADMEYLIDGRCVDDILPSP